MTPRIRTYDQAIDFLFGRINYERANDRSYSSSDFKLDRMRRFLDLVGNPQETIPVVHIAGTKGKGSTAVMAAAMLSAAGYRTGLFTSPHVSAFEERMTIDDRRPARNELVELVNRVIDAIDQLDRQPGNFAPTYFEIATALGWLYFADQRAEVAVLEVGMGGRLDATNICRPEVCVITSISLDHTAILGSTLAQIAGEKAGIIKPDAPVVSGVMDAEPRDVIRGVALRAGARLWELGREIRVDVLPREPDRSANGPTAGVSSVRARIETTRRGPLTVDVPLLGEHQAANAALAIAAIDILCEKRWKVSDNQIRAGLGTVRWPVRIELIARNPAVIVDAAHNVASARALAGTLEACAGYRRRTLIFAGTRDKDVPGILRELLPQFDRVIFTQYRSNPRALSVEEAQQSLNTLDPKFRLPEVQAASNPAAALRLARDGAHRDDLICVAGSFFVAAEIRELVVDEMPNSSPVEDTVPAARTMEGDSIPEGQNLSPK